MTVELDAGDIVSDLALAYGTSRLGGVDWKKSDKIT